MVFRVRDTNFRLPVIVLRVHDANFRVLTASFEQLVAFSNGYLSTYDGLFNLFCIIELSFTVKLFFILQFNGITITIGTSKINSIIGNKRGRNNGSHFIKLIHHRFIDIIKRKISSFGSIRKVNEIVI